MSKPAWIAAFVWIVVVGHAHGQAWKDKYKEAQVLVEQEKYAEAAPLATESLNGYLAEGSPSVETHSAILRLLSSISYGKQDFAEGLTFADKEIQLREVKKDTSYAVALTNKAMFQQQLGQYEGAVASLATARTILSAAYPQNHLSVIACSVGIATNLYLQNKYDEARTTLGPALELAGKKGEYTEEILEGHYYGGMIELESGRGQEAVAAFARAAEQFEATSMTESATYPLVLYGKAQAHQLLSQFDLAEGLYQRSQAIYEKLLGKEGDSYYSIIAGRVVNFHQMGQGPQATELMSQLKNNKAYYASASAALGTFYHGRNEWEKADGYYRDALANYDKSNKGSQLEYAATNLNLAALCADLAMTKEALERVTESGVIISNLRGKDNALYLSVLNRTGLVREQADQFAEAEAAFTEARRLAARLPVVPDAERSVLLNGLGEIAMKKGNYARADSMFQAVLGPYEAGGKSRDRYYSASLVNLAACRQFQGRFNDALALVRKSVGTTRKLYGVNSLAYGNALENESILRMRLGDMANAKVSLDSAVIIYEQSGKESLPYADGLMSLARYQQITGDYTRAEPYLKNAREIIRAKKGTESPEFANVQNSLALLYQTLGNYRDAEASLLEAKTILQKTRGTTHAEYATVVQNLAALYQLEGAYDKAEPLQREALDIDRKVLGENHPHYAITLQNMATLSQKLGRKDEAKGMLEKVLNITGQQLGKKHPSYITTLSNLAALYQDQGNFVQAEIHWKQSADLRKEVLGEDHPDYARSLYGLAGVYHAQGQWSKAKIYYEPVVDKYLKQVEEFFPALSEKEKSAFYAKIKPVFDAYQDFFVQYLHAVPAEREVTLGKLYDLQLNTKAILLAATNKVRARILTSGDPGLQELFRNWLGTKEQIVRYISASKDDRDKLGLNLAQLEDRANELEKQLSAKSDAFRSHVEKEKIRWTDVRNSLDDGEAAIEILRIRKKYTKDSLYYVGLILRKGSPSPEMIIWKHGAQLEGRKFKYHRNTIKYHVNDTVSYAFYWQPIEDRVKAGTTLYLSCDGVFNKVNFNSLYEPDSRRFVIDGYKLHQVSNTRELLDRKTAAKTSSNSATLFGFADFNLGEADVVAHGSKRNLARSLGFEGESIPVLPATEKEVDEIAGLLTKNAWHSLNYKRIEATEENLKKQENPKVMHIATHGFFLSDVDLDDSENSELAQNPLFRSGVLLAGAGVDREESKRVEDGVLTAYEAMNLNLDQTELVVLSACETGLGEVRNGEGVYGLQRSFLVAGANTVLMSLWQVDDVATQELMNAFYGFWVSGTEKHEAFRKAQLQMKEKYQIPYFWGAFVLIGN